MASHLVTSAADDEDDQDVAAVERFDIPAPPETDYPSLRALKDAVHAFAKSHGYELVLKKPCYNASDQAYKYYLRCKRGGTLDNTRKLKDEERKRTKRRSNKCNCPMRIIIAASDPSNAEGEWQVRSSVDWHNHPSGLPVPTKPAKSHVPRTSRPVKTLFRGGCLCGNISYESASLPLKVAYCHCVTCRKLSGGAFIPFADIKSSDLKLFDEGEQIVLPLQFLTTKSLHIFAVSDKALRASCMFCHTPIAMQYLAEPGIISVAVGTIDEDAMSADAKTALKPSSHIFTEQNVSWYNVWTDRLPCHARESSG